MLKVHFPCSTKSSSPGKIASLLELTCESQVCGDRQLEPRRQLDAQAAGAGNRLQALSHPGRSFWLALRYCLRSSRALQASTTCIRIASSRTRALDADLPICRFFNGSGTPIDHGSRILVVKFLDIQVMNSSLHSIY